MMNLIHILSHPISTHTREPHLSVFVYLKTLLEKNKLIVGLYSYISFKLGMIVETTKLWTSIYLDDLDFHSRSHLHEKSKTHLSILSEFLLSIWMKFSLLPQPVVCESSC